MFPINWRSGSLCSVVAIAILMLLAGCGPTRYAFFQPQQNASLHAQLTTDRLVASADTLEPQSVTEPVALTTSGPLPTAAPNSSALGSIPQPVVNSTRHRNPDSYHNQRFGRLFRSLPLAHVAPRTHAIDKNSSQRKTYKLALVALGASILAFGSLFVTAGGTFMWVVSITLPLTATLLGTASLTTIKRNPDRFRGKGWAMAAIMLGTGVLGLGLVALAALSVSETINR